MKLVAFAHPTFLPSQSVSGIAATLEKVLTREDFAPLRWDAGTDVGGGLQDVGAPKTCRYELDRGSRARRAAGPHFWRVLLDTFLCLFAHDAQQPLQERMTAVSG